MPYISVKAHWSQKRRICGLCGRRIKVGDLYLAAFGMGDEGDKPYGMALCIVCAHDSKNPRVREEMLTVAPDAYADQLQEAQRT